MRVLCVGDIHIRASAPKNRKDDYVKSLFGKIDQIKTIAKDGDCSVVLQAGDLFDLATPPFSTVRKAIISLMEDTPWLVVLGQHDLRFHNAQIENTPMGVLEAAGVVEVLGPDPWVGVINGKEVHIYGCSWDAKIPEIQDPDNNNILVMHRMVIGPKKLWEAQEEYDWARAILRRNPFDLIVTGDNHHFFTDSIPGDRHLVNCGSLMRANIDQGDHEPAVVIYDTEARTIKTVKLDVALATDVFDLDKAKVEKERNAELDAFIEQVGQTSGAPDLDYLGNLHKLSRAEGVPESVTVLVDKIVEEATHG